MDKEFFWEHSCSKRADTSGKFSFSVDSLLKILRSKGAALRVWSVTDGRMIIISVSTRNVLFLFSFNLLISSPHIWTNYTNCIHLPSVTTTKIWKRHVMAHAEWRHSFINMRCFSFLCSDSSISTRVDMLTPAIEVYTPPLWHKDETLESNLGMPSTSSDL